LRKGEYRLITSLMRLLEDGPTIKAQVDTVIDLCEVMQNLRQAIFELVRAACADAHSRATTLGLCCPTRALTTASNLAQLEKVHAALPSRRPHLARVFTQYLSRYFFLICFNAYFRDEAKSRFAKRFVAWYNVRRTLLPTAVAPRRWADERRRW
jgi:hypothetical protein